MKRRRIITSQVEGLEPWEQTQARLESMPRPELERFAHDLIGISWRGIRQTSKAGLVRWILEEWEVRP